MSSISAAAVSEPPSSPLPPLPEVQAPSSGGGSRSDPIPGGGLEVEPPNTGGMGFEPMMMGVNPPMMQAQAPVGMGGVEVNPPLPAPGGNSVAERKYLKRMTALSGEQQDLAKQREQYLRRYLRDFDPLLLRVRIIRFLEKGEFREFYVGEFVEVAPRRQPNENFFGGLGRISNVLDHLGRESSSCEIPYVVVFVMWDVVGLR
jgi:hypothetical protein